MHEMTGSPMRTCAGVEPSQQPPLTEDARKVSAPYGRSGARVASERPQCQPRPRCPRQPGTRVQVAAMMMADDRLARDTVS